MPPKSPRPLHRGMMVPKIATLAVARAGGPTVPIVTWARHVRSTILLAASAVRPSRAPMPYDSDILDAEGLQEEARDAAAVRALT